MWRPENTFVLREGIDAQMGGPMTALTHIPALSWCVDVVALLMALAFHFIGKALKTSRSQAQFPQDKYEGQRFV
jgi:hypothetical protein